MRCSPSCHTSRAPRRCTTSSSAARYARPACRPPGRARRRRIGCTLNSERPASIAGATGGRARHPVRPPRLRPVDPAAPHGDGPSHQAQAAAHSDALWLDDQQAFDAAAGDADPWPDGRPATDGRHAGRRHRPARGLFRLRRRRRLHALADLFAGAIDELVDLLMPNCSGAGGSGSRSATISVRIADAPAGAVPRTDHP